MAMSRERAIEIINDSNPGMDAAIEFADLTDGEVINEAREIMIDRIIAIARFCGTDMSRKDARMEWEASEND